MQGRMKGSFRFPKVLNEGLGLGLYLAWADVSGVFRDLWSILLP